MEQIGSRGNNDGIKQPSTITWLSWCWLCRCTDWRCVWICNWWQKTHLWNIENVQPSGECGAVNVLHVIYFVEMWYETCAFRHHQLETRRQKEHAHKINWDMQMDTKINCHGLLACFCVRTTHTHKSNRKFTIWCRPENYLYMWNVIPQPQNG